MRPTMFVFAVGLWASTTGAATTPEELNNLYHGLTFSYSRLMVYSEACKLEARFGLKSDVLATFAPVLDTTQVAIDLDRAFEEEKLRNGNVPCDLELTQMYSDRFSRELSELVDAINSNLGR